MFESFLITSRDTFEAALVIGTVFAYLNKTNSGQYRKTAYYGIFCRVLLSVLGAFLFSLFVDGFQGRAEQISEGITMLLGAFLLTTMILWMMQQKYLTREIEGQVEKHLQKSHIMFSHLGIFLLILVAVLREGVEMVIFLKAASYAGGTNLIGGILGVAAAVFVGYMFFANLSKINLKSIFNVSSILLILFAAGLVLHGTHEFVEAGIIPGIVTPIFDISHVLSDESIFGSFLKGLFGYVSNPSLVEILAYAAYLGRISYLYLGIRNSGAAAKNQKF